MDYATLIPYIFKRFSVISAFRTALPTLRYYAARPELAESKKPALFTMNILPPAATVWHHCARKHLGDAVDIVIFDSSGKLDPKDFPGTIVQPFLNLYAAVKCDEFMRHVAKKRKVAWLCDDDIFIINGKTLDVIERELSDPLTASISFRPRMWWQIDIDGKRVYPSATYCTAFNRDIFVEREKLSLRPADGNTHPSLIGKPMKRYDTGDKANEILLRKGYRCAIIPKADEPTYIAGFAGMSAGVMLLWYFKTAEQTTEYLLSPPKQQWSGNTLFRMLCALLTISTIQECHKKITGWEYPLPSLPSHDTLLKIREDHLHLLRPDQSFEWLDEAAENLVRAL